jgi:hypothetical protein
VRQFKGEATPIHIPFRDENFSAVEAAEFWEHLKRVIKSIKHDKIRSVLWWKFIDNMTMPSIARRMDLDLWAARGYYRRGKGVLISQGKLEG